MLQPKDLYTDDELLVATPEERRRYFAFLQKELHRLDPVAWGHDRLDEVWWSAQKAVAWSVVNNRRTAVKSCHDVGKSFIAARVVAWWIDNHDPGEAFVVTSAPTFQQVRGILWREIGQAHRKGRLAGRVNLTEWFVGPQLVGFGRKPSDTDPTAFQGIHAKYVLVVLDEACGIPQSLWDAASTLVTNDHSRILAIGNPDDPQSHFARVCAMDGWNVIGISALDSPNFTGEEVPTAVRDVLISPTWVEEKRIEWGENSPIYTSKVLGEFPEDSSDGIVPYSWAASCRTPRPAAGPQADDVQLGVDIGAGGDETVIRERKGMKAGRTWRFRHGDAMRSVGEIVQVILETGATKAAVDVIGVGYGVHGRLVEVCRERAIKCEVIGVNVGERARQPQRFANLKAEIWWEVGRELSRSQGWDLCDVDDQTIAEMTAHRYTFDSSGRIRVESKDDVRARIDRSPDNADALLLAFYRPAPAVEFLGVA